MKHELLTNSLLQWYYEVKRDLPWRKESDPYRIWVSEIMLQQTQVDTVIPYYERFMKRFPTLNDLAVAEEEEVLKYWEGLGYYSRARNLHHAVKEVQSTYGGVVPNQERELGELKGVGPYTKGAILSIAFNQPVPAVDGNVMRVISRIYALENDIAKQSTRREIEKLVREIIPQADPSGFNQALMELGALICSPRNPKCTACPVQSLCKAKIEGKVDMLPIKKVVDKKRDVHLVTLVFIHNGKALVHKRDENLLKGMWEFPSFERKKSERISPSFLAEKSSEHFGLLGDAYEYLGNITHIFSHLRWKMEVYRVDLGGRSELLEYEESEEINRKLDDSYRWVTYDELAELPFPVPHQKVSLKWKKSKATQN